jgi:hypothetical protein
MSSTRMVCLGLMFLAVPAVGATQVVEPPGEVPCRLGNADSDHFRPSAEQGRWVMVIEDFEAGFS